MKKYLVLIGLVVSVFVFSACEKNEYQHPAHRSGGVR